MIEVEAPDGTIVEFPDGTPDAVMEKAMREAYGGPQEAAKPGSGAFGAAGQQLKSGAFFGFDDEIGAGMMAPIHAGMDWMKGEGFDMGRAYTRLQKQLDDEKQMRRQAHPVASAVGDIAGGLGLGAGAAKAGLSLAARPGTSVMGAAGRGAVEGAAYGGLYGAGEARPGERLLEAGKGAGFGAAAGGLLGGIGGAVSRRGAQAAAPSTDDLAAASNRLYRAADQAGITVKAPAFNRLSQNVEAAAGRLNKDLRPNTAGIVDDVLSMKGRNISLQELDELRQVVGQSMAKAQPQDVRTLQRIKDVIDGFADNIRPGDFTGDPRGFGLIKEARQLWSRKAKSQIIDEIVEKAKNQATGFENGLVIHMRALANNPKRMKAFSPEEQKLIQSVVRRGTVHGILRALGMLSPNSTFGGLMAGGVGVGAGLLEGGALAGTGMAARSAAGALTRGKVNTLQNAVATGIPPNMLPRLAAPNKLAPLIPGGVEGVLGARRYLEGQ